MLQIITYISQRYYLYWSNISGPHAGVGQFSSGEVGPTLNYFGTHHMWSNVIGPHLASLFQPLIICHFEVERHWQHSTKKILSSTFGTSPYFKWFYVILLVYIYVVTNG